MANSEYTFSIVVAGESRGAVAAMDRVGEATDGARKKLEQFGDTPGPDAALDRAAAKLHALDNTQLRGKDLHVADNIDNVERKLAKLELSGANLKTGITNGLQGAFDNFTSQLGPVGSGLQSIQGQIGALGPVALGAGAGVAALGVVVTKGVGEFLDLAKSVETFGLATGASAEQASRIIAVTDDVGISAETTQRAFVKLSQAADSKAFERLGIEVAKTKDGSTDLVGTFENVLASLEHITDPIQRANVLQTAFGKSYAELLPLIERGAAGFRDSVDSVKGQQVLTEAQIQSAREFRETMDGLGDAAKEFLLVAGKIALPFLKEAAADATKLLEGVYNVADGVSDFVDRFGPLRTLLGYVWKAAVPLVGVFDLIGNMSMDGIKDALQDLIDLADKIAGPFLNFPDDVFNDKQNGVSLATARLREETEKANASRAEYNDRVTGNADALEALAEAERAAAEAAKEAARILDDRVNRAAAASLTLAASQRTAEQTAVAYAAALDGTGEFATKAAKAEAGSATATVSATEKRLAAMKTAREQADAERSLAAAHERVAAAQASGAEAVTNAAAREQAAHDKTLAALDKVTKAQEAHRTAADAVGPAIDRLTTAQAAYDRVTQGSTDVTRELTAAIDAQSAARDRLAAFSDNEAAAEARRVEASLALAAAEATAQADADETIRAMRRSVADATDTLAAAEKRVAEARATGKPAAEIAAGDREVEAARDRLARTSRELQLNETSIGDVSDVIAEKRRALAEADRNLARVRADHAKDIAAEADATGKLREITEGATIGSEAETKAKQQLTTAAEALGTARDKERTAAEADRAARREAVAAAEAEHKAEGEIQRAREASAKALATARAELAKAVETIKLKELEATVEAEKAQAKRAAAIVQTSDLEAKRLNAVLGHIAAETKAELDRRTKADGLDHSAEEAEIRRDQLREARQAALSRGHDGLVKQIDREITAIESKPDILKRFTLKSNLDEVDKDIADTKSAIDSKLAKTHNGALAIDNANANAKLDETRTRLDAFRNGGAAWQAKLETVNEANASNQIDGVLGKLRELHQSGQAWTAQVETTNEANASTQIDGVLGKLRELHKSGQSWTAQVETTNEANASNQAETVLAKLRDIRNGANATVTVKVDTSKWAAWLAYLERYKAFVTAHPNSVYNEDPPALYRGAVIPGSPDGTLVRVGDRNGVEVVLPVQADPNRSADLLRQSGYLPQLLAALADSPTLTGPSGARGGGLAVQHSGALELTLRLDDAGRLALDSRTLADLAEQLGPSIRTYLARFAHDNG